MTVRIARGARPSWRDGRLQFRFETNVESPALLAVLREIAARLVELDTDDEYGPKFVSDFLVLPNGAAFWLDSPDASPAMADRIVDTIVEGLNAAGFDGRLSGPGKDLERARGPQVALAAVPRHPPARDALAMLPWDEVERALDWALDDLTGYVVVESGAVFLDMAPPAARGYVTYLHRRGRSWRIIAESAIGRRECSIGHPAEELRTLSCPHLGLAWSGPAVQTDIDVAFESMIERGRLVGPWAATVQVTVHPDAHEAFVVNPPWHSNDPSGREATVALDDHVLDAFPWQRLSHAQAQRLPTPLHRDIVLDEAKGELRMGRLDLWLREPATARARDFTRTMRSFLGHALATRDVAWARQQALPTSTPRSVAESSVDEPQVDLDTVGLASHPRAHPSLGVTPLELLSLRRGQPFYDAVGISPPLRTWLDGLATPATLDPEPVRRAVDALAGADIGERHALTHMDVFADWLVRRFTPDLVGAAGYGDADALRDRLPALSTTWVCSDTVKVLLDLLAQVISVDPQAATRNPSDTSPAFRTAAGIAHRSGAAACVGQPRGRRDAFNDVSSQVRTMLWNGAPLDDTTVRALWSTAVIAAGYEAVADAYERAVYTDARHALQWRDTKSGSWPVESFADHGSVAVFRTNDPDAAWDLAVELGSVHQPVFGTELIASLTARLPSAVIEAGWATARRALAGTHARTRRAAAYATSTGTAAVVCQLAAAAAAEAGRSDLLHEVTWTAVDDLVAELTS